MISFFLDILSDMIYSLANSIVPSFLLDSFIVLFYKVIWAPLFLYECFTLAFSFFFMLLLNAVPSISFNLVDWIDAIVIDRYTALTRRIHLPKHRAPKQFTPSISFMGGGQLWMYSIGVGHYVYENYDIDKIKFLASSAGTFAAVPLACGRDPYEWCKRDWEKCITHFESRGVLGCLFDTKQFYYDLWNEYLPKDEDGLLPDGRMDPNFVPVHVRCSGRLFISVTVFPSLKNKVISQFSSRSDLIWTVVASMCLPFAFIRDFPVRCGPSVGWCVDGGFSNDSPCLDSYTITVSALHKEADVQCIAAPHQLKAEKQRLRNRKAALLAGEGQGQGQQEEARRSNRSKSTAWREAQQTQPAADGGAAAPAPAPAPVRATTPLTSGSRRTREKKIARTNTVFVIDGEESEADSLSHARNASDSGDDISLGDEESESDACTFGTLSESESDLDDEPRSDAEMAAEEEAELDEDTRTYHYALAHRIRPIDIIRTPSFRRVWEVGYLGQLSASRCEDFERHEWLSIRLRKRPLPLVPPS